MRMTPRAVVHAIGQLNDRGLEHVVRVLAVHVPRSLVLSRARVHPGAYQRARSILIQVGCPFEQSAVVRDPVEVGALLVATVPRRVAVLQLSRWFYGQCFSFFLHIKVECLFGKSVVSVDENAFDSDEK